MCRRRLTPTPARADAAPADRGLAARLALAGLVAAGFAVPFALLAVAVRAGSGPLPDADQAIAAALHAQVVGRPWLASTLEVLAVVTHPNTMRVAAGAVAVLLWTRGHRRRVAWLVVTMTVGGLLSPLLKALVARDRPVFADPVALAAGYSFPSGHALNSMLFAASVLVLVHPVTSGPRRAGVWVAAVLLVAVIGFDRIALGVHFAGDVVGGWIVALATVCATTTAFRTSPVRPSP